MNVFHLGLPVIVVAYGPIVEANLPDFGFLISLFVNAKGAAALDTLNCFFEAGRGIGSEEDMEMVWHYDKFVKQVNAAVSVAEKGFEQDFGDFWDLENGAA